MVYEPILGKNVKRHDSDMPTPWNNFFRNAANVFNVPEKKVIPFDVELVYGNDNPINHDMGSNSGSMRYRGDSDESILGINDTARESGSTAEHEYMHGIGNYFGAGNSMQDERLNSNDAKNFRLWSRDFDPRDPIKNAREAYLENPELYNSELASHITGYGGPFGDYERQMMQDSWEKRGPLNQWSIDQRPVYYKERKPLERKNKFDGYFMNKKFYRQNDAQQNALENVFNNNPNNNRLGIAKEYLAPMVAQVLSDDQYLLNSKYRSLNKPTQKTFIDSKKKKRNINEGYGTFSEHGYGGSTGPKYLDSIEERFARLGAQYMKETNTDTFRHNAMNQTDFRLGMNNLLLGPLSP